MQHLHLASRHSRDMFISPLFVALATLPLTLRLIALVVPAHRLEPYAFWDASILNGPNATTQWRNMGYWEDRDDFAAANERLARKLLELAHTDRAPETVLDLAHGAGESLCLHLERDPPPAWLGALTSQPTDTRRAQALVQSRYPNTTTAIEWYTSGASFVPTSGARHPLNPMRGYMGESSRLERADDEDGVESEEAEGEEHGEDKAAGPRTYDLTYILDAIYHFPPSLPHFLSTLLPAMTPGGVLIYTDILPPPGLNNVLGRLVLPTLFAVPSRNLMHRDNDLERYAARLERVGFGGIEIHDWTEHVFAPLAEHLRAKGAVWRGVARLFQWVERSGWKFIAVRAERPVEDRHDVHDD